MKKENAEILKMFNKKINAIMTAESTIIFLLNYLTNYKYTGLADEAHKRLVDSLQIKEDVK